LTKPVRNRQREKLLDSQELREASLDAQSCRRRHSNYLFDLVAAPLHETWLEQVA